MEDLREVGKKVIKSVRDLGASTAGDLALGIGRIINELYKHPGQDKEKLDYLDGLFREFAFGEEYELRLRVLTPAPTQGMMINTNKYVLASGANNTQVSAGVAQQTLSIGQVMYQNKDGTWTTSI